MNDAVICPFKPEECEVLNQLLEHFAATRAYLDKCERCGLNVSDAKAENAAQTDFVESVKREWFPMSA